MIKLRKVTEQEARFYYTLVPIDAHTGEPAQSGRVWVMIQIHARYADHTGEVTLGPVQIADDKSSNLFYKLQDLAIKQWGGREKALNALNEKIAANVKKLRPLLSEAEEVELL